MIAPIECALWLSVGLGGCTPHPFPDPPAGRIGEFEGVESPAAEGGEASEAEAEAAVWTEEDCESATEKISALIGAGDKLSEAVLQECKDSRVGKPLDRTEMACYMSLEKFHHLADCAGDVLGGDQMLPKGYTYTASALGPKPKSEWTKDDCDAIASKVAEWGPVLTAMTSPALYGHCVESQVGEPLDRDALECSLKQKARATAMIKCRMKLPTLKRR